MFLSGIPGFDANGALPDDFEAQFANVVTNIGNVLTQAGATFKHLVKVNVLLTRASDVATMNRLYAEAFGTVRIFVFEAILMNHEGASYGDREGRFGSASCRA